MAFVPSSLDRRQLLGGIALSGVAASLPASAQGRIDWDMEADVVVIGAGATGLPAAIAARDAGADVLVIDVNYDVGGKMLMSGGMVRIGGGNRLQREHGVEDSEEQVFLDWIDPTDRNSRYSDREVIRAFADENLATFAFLEENGVRWKSLSGPSAAESVKRIAICAPWPVRAQTIVYEDILVGAGIARPLEASARNKGVRFLLQHRLTEILRPDGDRVTGVRITPVDRNFKETGAPLSVRARRGVIVATGGHSGNVALRRIFDPRLTEEYQAVGGDWVPEWGDGETLSMKIGASLWGTANQTQEAGAALDKGRLGVKHNYVRGQFTPESSNFFRAGASGLVVKDWQNLILVKENGRRFWDETKSGYDYFAAALAWSGDPDRLNGGGPIWAIFDSDAATREGWNVTAPHVDRANGYFFSSDSIEGLARQLVDNPYQWRAMPDQALRDTVATFNNAVTQNHDPDFGRTALKYRIAKPPFFAAWCTPVIHDCYAGLRISPRAEIMDMDGKAIPGLFTGGDTMGGFAMHGLGRAIVFGRIAGASAARMS